MTRSKRIDFLYSFTLGSLLTVLTVLIGMKSGVLDIGLIHSGGIEPGWRGLPIPFYYFGVWGDSMTDLSQCVRFQNCGNTALSVLFMFFDLVIWSSGIHVARKWLYN